MRADRYGMLQCFHVRRSYGCGRSPVSYTHLIGVVCQRDAAVEDPGKDDLYEVGVIGEIIKILEMPDESTTVILQGKMKRFRIDEITETFPYMRANVSLENEILPDANDKEFEALVSALKDLTFELLKNIGEQAKE